MSEAMIAQLAPPSSLPAKSAFFLFSAMGRMLLLDRVGIDLNAAVVEEADQAVPVVQAIADRLGCLGVARQFRELFSEPRFQRITYSAARIPCGHDGLGSGLFSSSAAGSRVGCHGSFASCAARCCRSPCRR